MMRNLIYDNNNGNAVQRFTNVLLDADGTLYTFHNDLPIYLEGEGLRKFGIAQLYKKRKKLYANLILENDLKYGQLFAHLLHDVYGHIFAILLATHALPDPFIPCLQEGAATG